MREGMKVGVRPAGRRRGVASLRPAEVVKLVDKPGYRRNRAEVRFDDGTTANLPLGRLAPPA